MGTWKNRAAAGQQNSRRMIIIDITVWIDYLEGTTNSATAWLDRELGRHRMALTDLILCEILQGIRKQADFVRYAIIF